MGLKKALDKIFLVDLLKGLSVTFRYQHPREVYTEQGDQWGPAPGL